MKYLYVFEKSLYDTLTSLGRPCLSHTQDIHGKDIWVFQSDGHETFALDGGCVLSNELHMAL